MRALTVALCAALLALVVAAVAPPPPPPDASPEPSGDALLLPSALPLASPEPDAVVDPSAEPAPRPPTPTPAPTRAANRRVYAVSLELLHARAAVIGRVDAAVRIISASATRSAPSDWTLINAGPHTATPTPTAQPDADADVAVVISRQEMASDRGPRPLRSWRALYHARVPADAMAVYTAFVRDGDMSAALRARGGVGFMRASLLSNPREIHAAPMLRAPVGAVGPDSPVSDIPAPDTPALAPATASPTSGASQTSPRKSAPRSAPRARAASLSWQISVGVGLVGLAAAVAVLALLAFRGRRRAAHDEQSIGALSRSPSEALSMPEYRVTSVGPPPRGHDALRHQAGIMHWQNDAAAAGAAGAVARDTSSSGGASLYATQSSSHEARSMTADSYSYTGDDDVRPIDSLASTAFALGDESPSPSSSRHEAATADGAPDQLSFVTFGANFGGPT